MYNAVTSRRVNEELGGEQMMSQKIVIREYQQLEEQCTNIICKNQNLLKNVAVLW